jgi:hypothetical protein
VLFILSVSELKAAIPDATANSVILARWSCNSAIRDSMISGSGNHCEELILASHRRVQHGMYDRDAFLEFLEVVRETSYCVEKVCCGAVVAWRCLEDSGIDDG